MNLCNQQVVNHNQCICPSSVVELHNSNVAGFASDKGKFPGFPDKTSQVSNTLFTLALSDPIFGIVQAVQSVVKIALST